MAEAKKVKFAVFRDDDGNRFVFPSIYEDEEQSIDWGQCVTLRLCLGIKDDPEGRLEVSTDETGDLAFPHVKSMMTHPGLLHGGATVFLIGGPVFEEVKAEQAAA